MNYRTLSIFLAGFASALLLFMFSAYKPTTGNNGNISVQEVHAPKLPDVMDLAGERVPLELNEVRERVDREILMNVFRHAATMNVMKLANRYFPVIEPILARNGVPDDFKYLAVIESELRNLTSPAGAKGYWQFMKGTAAEYNLEVSEEIDERQDIEKSTEAACRYLNNSHNRQGSWTAAAAAYNMGDGGFQKNATAQLSTNYYDLYLSTETQRYVSRILAMKEIMKNPEKYGFFLDKEDLYPTLDNVDIMVVDGTIPSWADYAAQFGIPYATFRFYNPWITAGSLSNKLKKTYKVSIPKDQQRNKE